MTKLFDKELLYLQDESGKLNLFSIALPIMLQQVFSYLLGTVHTYLMTGVSPEAVASIGVTNVILSAVTVLANFAAFGGQVLMSYELGRGNKEKVRKLLGGCIIAVTVVLGVAVAALFTAAPAVIRLYHLTGAAYDYALNYFKIRMVYIMLFAYTTCFCAVLRCYGNTVVVLISNLATQVINIALSFAAVKSQMNNLSTVKCVAWACNIAQILGLIVAAIYAVKLVKPSFKVEIKSLTNICTLGFPAIFGNLSYQICNVIITGIIASFGTVVINANVFTNNISTYASLVSWSIASANSVMLGRLFGKNKIEKGKKMVAQNTVISFVFNSGISVLILIFCRPLMHIFTHDEEIVSLAFTLFAIDIAMECFRVFSHVYGESALVCAKDIVFTSVTGIAISWIFGVGGCVLFCKSFGWGLIGARLALLLNEGCKSMTYFVRWKTGAWVKNTAK